MDHPSQPETPHGTSEVPVCCAAGSHRWLLLTCLALAGLAGLAGLLNLAGQPAAKLPRLVDLGATTCIPCKEMEPILESLRTGYAGKLTVDFINVRTEPEKAKPYKIETIPTQIWFDAAGQELYRHEGVIPAADIVAKFKEHGIDLGVLAAPGNAK